MLASRYENCNGESTIRESRIKRYLMGPKLADLYATDVHITLGLCTLVDLLIFRFVHYITLHAAI